MKLRDATQVSVTWQPSRRQEETRTALAEQRWKDTTQHAPGHVGKVVDGLQQQQTAQLQRSAERGQLEQKTLGGLVNTYA